MEVMSMLPAANMSASGPNSAVALTTYTYTSAPKPIANRNARGAPKNGRIIRGSNFCKDDGPPPKWNPYFAYARSLSRSDKSLYESEETSLRRKEFRRKLEERARLRRENLGISSLHSTKGSIVVRNPASQYVSGINRMNADVVHSTPRYIRRSKTTTTISTQVFEDELQPLENAEDATVYALVTNILRESALEVALEAAGDRSRMEKFAEKRFEALGGVDENERKSLDADDFNAETRKDPEGEETADEGV